jgi:ribose-phosphate pyrophosphokinase
MSPPLFIPFPENEQMASRLAALCGGETGSLDLNAFPDGESHLRFRSDLAGRSVVLVCTLARPDPKIPALIFAAEAARDLGARRVGLVAPYLCYMRQDRRFQPGEAVTSRSFAALLSRSCDWLATIDPHLHRYKSLGEIYSSPARALHAGPAIAEWIRINVDNPFLIGPDEESRQWVGAVAADCGAAFTVLSKERLGDRSVKTSPAELRIPQACTPVILDDIVSTGATMVEALRLLRSFSSRQPIAIGVHGLLCDGAGRILEAGGRLVTTNTVPNPMAAIDMSGLIAAGIADLAA